MNVLQGRLLNLDAGGLPPSDLSPDALPVEVSDAELRLGAQWRPEIRSDVVLVHEEGQSTFEQVFATWSAPAATLSFGKQTLPMGLYPGRLIHDPLVQADLETITPSFWVRRGFGPLEAHAALAAQSHALDSLADETQPSAILALDLTTAATKIRLSGKIAHHLRVVDLGTEVGAGPLVFDLEGLFAEGEWTETDNAFLFGISWNPTETTTLSARLDARNATNWTRSIAVGGIQRFAEIAYAGAEWLHDLDGDGALTLRCGLEVELGSP